MKIPQNVIKTVAFIAYRDRQTNEAVPVGSCFFVGQQDSPEQAVASRVFVVTAKHVIESLRSKGCESCLLRLNPIDRRRKLIELEIPIERWRFHPSDENVDVAVLEQGVPAEADHLVIPLSLGADVEKFSINEVDLGDEVFVSRLFIHHSGQKRNTPIVRVGSLAALAEEKVRTKRGYIDAYLIEARSIGGLSGSPVFVNLGTTRMIAGEMKVHTGGPNYFLHGLIHGHFRAAVDDRMVTEGGRDVEHELVNAGIAIVVPFEKVTEAIAPLIT